MFCIHLTGGLHRSSELSPGMMEVFRIGSAEEGDHVWGVVVEFAVGMGITTVEEPDDDNHEPRLTASEVMVELLRHNQVYGFKDVVFAPSDFAAHFESCWVSDPDLVDDISMSSAEQIDQTKSV